MKSTMILLILVTAIEAVQPSLAGNSTIDVENVVRATETFLEELNRYEELSLAVMIAKDGVPALEKAYGLANRSFNVPNRVDTKFNLTYES